MHWPVPFAVALTGGNSTSVVVGFGCVATSEMDTLALIVRMVPKIGRFRVCSAESTRNRRCPGRVLPDSRARASFSAKLG